MDRRRPKLPAQGAPFAARAHADALQLLERRPLTELELRRGLKRRGHADDAVQAALERLAGAGHVDDRALSLHYIVTRAERLGHGRDRLLRELEGRGVHREVAEAAWELALRQGQVDPRQLLRAALDRQIERQGGNLSGTRRARVYNALLRAGFDPELIDGSLRPPDEDEQLQDGTDDDDFA